METEGDLETGESAAEAPMEATETGAGKPGRRAWWMLLVMAVGIGVIVALAAMGGRKMASQDAAENMAANGQFSVADTRPAVEGKAAMGPPASAVEMQSVADESAGIRQLRGGPQPLPSLAQVGRTLPFATRQIIKNADLSIEVSDLNEAVNRATEIASRLGGLVVASRLGGGPEGQAGAVNRWASLTLRAPADRFDAAMIELRQLGRVVAENQSSQDVTEEAIDLEARAANLEEQERRLRALLGRAGKIEEIMQVENELARVRTEIDGLRGRQRFLADQAAYSTVNLNMRETPLAAKGIESPGWKGVGERAAAAFVRAVNALLTVGAGLLVVVAAALPVLLVLAVLIVLARAVARFWQARRAAGS